MTHVAHTVPVEQSIFDHKSVFAAGGILDGRRKQPTVGRNRLLKSVSPFSNECFRHIARPLEKNAADVVEANGLPDAIKTAKHLRKGI